MERRDDHEGDRRERDKVDADEVDGPHVGDARTRGEVLHQLLSEHGGLADEEHAAAHAAVLVVLLHPPVVVHVRAADDPRDDVRREDAHLSMRVWRVRDAVLGVTQGMTQHVGKMHTMMKVIVVSGEHGIDASQYL